MKTKLLSCLLLCLAALSLPIRAAAPVPTNDAAAAQLLADFLALDAERFPSTLPRSEVRPWSEVQSLKKRKLALAFLDTFPTDPRRWIIVDRLNSGSPDFVTDWGPRDEEGRPENPVVDKVAVVAWQTQVDGLKAALADAKDIPEELRETIAARQEMRKGFSDYLVASVTEARSGKPAPDFTMRDPEGREMKLSDFRGKVVVLDFWATWCSPCIAAMPHNQELAAKYRDQGVVVLASCTSDTREKFEKWVEANRAKYPDFVWGHDPASKTKAQVGTSLYGAGNIPAVFIIDREGRIVDRIMLIREGEVILEAALASAGVKVDPAIVALGAEQFQNLLK